MQHFEKLRDALRVDGRTTPAMQAVIDEKKVFLSLWRKEAEALRVLQGEWYEDWIMVKNRATFRGFYNKTDTMQEYLAERRLVFLETIKRFHTFTLPPDGIDYESCIESDLDDVEQVISIEPSSDAEVLQSNAQDGRPLDRDENRTEMGSAENQTDGAVLASTSKAILRDRQNVGGKGRRKCMCHPLQTMMRSPLTLQSIPSS